MIYMKKYRYGVSHTTNLKFRIQNLKKSIFMPANYFGANILKLYPRFLGVPITAKKP